MDIRKIKTLIEMLEESNLNEIEVSQGEESVRISKSSRDTSIVSGSVNQNNIEKVDSAITLNQESMLIVILIWQKI